MANKPKRPPRQGLIEAWKAFHGSPPPKGLSTRLLHMACAYNEQVEQHGGLKKKTLRDLMRYAKPPMSKATRKNQASKSASSSSPGTRLVREWRGQPHVVDIIEGGVQYNGETYRSLSQVARTITGARWSGPRFFGV